MPMSLADLKSNTKSIKIRFPGIEGDLNLKIHPHRYTQAMQHRWEEAATAEDYEGMAEVFDDFIIEWDLLGEDGEPLPMEPDVIEQLGMGVLRAIFSKTAEVIEPNAKSRNRNGRS